MAKEDLKLKILNILERKEKVWRKENPHFNREDCPSMRANYSVWIYGAIEKGELDNELKELGYTKQPK